MFKIKQELTVTKRSASKKKKPKVVKKKKVFVDNYIIDNTEDLGTEDLNKSMIRDYVSTCGKEFQDFIKNWKIIKCKTSNFGIDITDETKMRLIVKDKGVKKHYKIVSAENTVILDIVK